MALTPKGPQDPKNNPEDTSETSKEDEILIREIDEAVRQDDAAQFFKKYGVALGSALTLGLVAFAGYLGWDYYAEQGLEKQSETLVTALDMVDSNNLDQASETASELISKDNQGARSAAQFIEAGAALEKGEMAKAAELYAAIAADEKSPPALRDLARIREVASNFDEREPADVIAKLKDMAVPGHAFFGSAGELVAMAHLEAGDQKAAGALFGAIAKDEDQPETLRSRARQMAGLLGVDAIEDVDKLLDDQGVNPEEGLTQISQ